MANILVARDQENLIHAQQTTAAGKSMNQSARPLHPKTPGNLKTPFRPAKNDENLPVIFTGQKAVGREGPSKLDRSTFVTPLVPRNRAPLGIKTTNVKAFQTPAPLPLTTKGPGTIPKHFTARRSGRSKIASAPSKPVDGDFLVKRAAEEQEPDFGYAPPPPTELPDPPIEFNEDSLLTEELQASYGVVYPYNSPKDENGMSLRLKKEEEEWQRFDTERVKKSLENMGELVFPTLAKLNAQVDKMIAAGPKKKRPELSRVDTMQAKSAVAALSDSQVYLPAATRKTTQASEQKKKGILLVTKPKPSTLPQRSSLSRPAHAAVSKNTIGFPKAKKAPSIIPRSAETERSGIATASKPIKIAQASIHPRDFRDLYGSPPEDSDMWFRLKQYELLEQDIAQERADDLSDDLFETDFFPFGNAKLDDEDFQLPTPE
ncbi:uncharacterized protein Z519_01955 [Cladophialophora bantiana CBS 173.52]|uniref:Uncharacterized protein n=1 Tax=Cladophialophora bantiana (strain ATCC 10958 / CBS 173.52 / CDC B-1940 / NIH 8579) TaxID=1442370 RepID=A0A0D2IIJ1_CLAB1|nr:uncharacterized protein Z519_01955 [Cladophialophora bantiana CBS 173.52]KIW96564.1 hypothetical protein Z519_01955 [Cladophialophora bantiana CBS 173.52]